MTGRWLTLMLAALLVSVVAGAAPASVRGRVTDPDGLPLPGVTVTLTSADGRTARTAVTGTDGVWMADVPAGRYRVRAELSGFSPAVPTDLLVEAEPVTLDLTLSLGPYAESVVVSAEPLLALMGEPQPDAPVTVTRAVIDSAMFPNSQYDDVLPLMPNVVRGPDGLISVAGTRATEGALVVNGVNVTDPLSGAPTLMLPIEAVEEMQVYAAGFPAEYGGATGGVTSVRTRAGIDHLHVSANSFFPRLLFQNGSLRGVEFWDPNAGASGPLVKGRLFVEQAVSYRFDRNRFETVEGAEINTFTTLISWTQIDAELSRDQHLLASISIDPQATDRAGITAFTRRSSVPATKLGGWAVSAADRLTPHESSSLEFRAALVHTRAEVTPGGSLPYAVSHDATSGSYYDRQDDSARRVEASASYAWMPAPAHVVKLGATASRAWFSGIAESAPVSMLRTSGVMAQLVDFAPGRTVSAATTELGAFVQDTWTATPWLTVDAGLRADRVTAAEATTLSPRAGWTIKAGHGASLTGSIGSYAGKLPLTALAFPGLPARTVQGFDETGVPGGARVTWHNVFAAPLGTPQAVRWNLALGQQIGTWQVRVKYQERHGRDELVVDTLPTGAAGGLLTLGNSGTSTSRSVETTVGYRAPAAHHEVYASYVRASARGDLNSFDVVGGLFREPFVQPNATGPLPADVPNRLLAWGVLHLPSAITVAPFAEVRDGFPYSPVDDDWMFAGPRDGGRLPWFGSVDLYVNKVVGLPRRLPDARVGLKIYNLASIHNARDVQRDVARVDYGTLYNPTPRDFSFVFELLWGNR